MWFQVVFAIGEELKQRLFLNDQCAVVQLWDPSSIYVFSKDRKLFEELSALEKDPVQGF